MWLAIHHVYQTYHSLAALPMMDGIPVQINPYFYNRSITNLVNGTGPSFGIFRNNNGQLYNQNNDPLSPLYRENPGASASNSSFIIMPFDLLDGRRHVNSYLASQGLETYNQLVFTAGQNNQQVAGFVTGDMQYGEGPFTPVGSYYIDEKNYGSSSTCGGTDFYIQSSAEPINISLFPDQSGEMLDVDISTSSSMLIAAPNFLYSLITLGDPAMAGYGPLFPDLINLTGDETELDSPTRIMNPTNLAQLYNAASILLPDDIETAAKDGEFYHFQNYAYDQDIWQSALLNPELARQVRNAPVDPNGLLVVGENNSSASISLPLHHIEVGVSNAPISENSIHFSPGEDRSFAFNQANLLDEATIPPEEIYISDAQFFASGTFFVFDRNDPTSWPTVSLTHTGSGETVTIPIANSIECGEAGITVEATDTPGISRFYIKAASNHFAPFAQDNNTPLSFSEGDEIIVTFGNVDPANLHIDEMFVGVSGAAANSKFWNTMEIIGQITAADNSLFLPSIVHTLPEEPDPGIFCSDTDGDGIPACDHVISSEDGSGPYDADYVREDTGITDIPAGYYDLVPPGSPGAAGANNPSRMIGGQ